MFPLLWIAITALLLGGAFVITSRNGPSTESSSPAAFVH